MRKSEIECLSARDLREAEGVRGFSRIWGRHQVRCPRLLSMGWWFRPRPRGQAVVEFAIILPFLLLLLVIAIDFGRVFASYVELMNGTREGAAYAATNPTDNYGITARVAAEANAQHQIGEGSLFVTTKCSYGDGTVIACATAAGAVGAGSFVTVSAHEHFTFMTPLISSVFGGHLDLRASSAAAILVLAPSGGGAPQDCGSSPTLPSPAFTATVDGRTVHLDASASEPKTGVCAISGYNWNMGDGLDPWPPVVGMNTDYTYTHDGWYTITLEATNPAGNNYQWQTVWVGGGPPSATPTPTLAPTPTPAPTTQPPVCNTAPTFTYNFTGNGSGTKAHQMTFYGAYTGQPAPASWLWTFGDGYAEQEPGQTVSRNYAAAGTYTVTLTVTNGSCVKQVSQQVVVP